MQEGVIGMSGLERERLVVLGLVNEKRLLQGEAAERLGVSARHLKRLLRRWRAEGDAGLVSRQRGRTT